MSDDKKAEEKSFDPVGAVKGVWGTITTAITIEKDVAAQNKALTQIINEVKDLTNLMLNLSVRVAKIESDLQAHEKSVTQSLEQNRATNKVESERVISEFINETRMKLREIEHKAEIDRAAQVIKGLEARLADSTPKNDT